MPEFKHFVNMGQPGEFSRFLYFGKLAKIKMHFVTYNNIFWTLLLDNEILSIAAIQTKAAQVAMKPKTVKHIKYYLTLTKTDQNLTNLSGCH